MEIQNEGYYVSYDPDEATIICRGSFRLRGSTGYAPLTELFNKAADDRPKVLTLNVQELEFLNSSGINTLSKLVLRVRKTNTSQIVVIGNKKYPWQRKSLKNLQRLMPGLELILE